MLRSYKELKVWQRSFDLCKRVYGLSRSFPADERFGLVVQVRRAAVSIPSNIAEGHSRDTTRDYVRFLWMAKGSLAEVETQLMLARELGFGNTDETEAGLEELDEIGRMLKGLIRSLGGEAARRADGRGTSAQSSIPNPQSSPTERERS
ncbi:MAG: four helix bundle protein [Planctomycetota bacterium]